MGQTYERRRKGLYSNSSIRVEGTVGLSSSSLACGCNSRQLLSQINKPGPSLQHEVFTKRNIWNISQLNLCFSAFFLVFPHPGPAQHFFNLFIFWLHQHGKLQVLYGILVSTKHLLQVKTTFNIENIPRSFWVCACGFTVVCFFMLKEIKECD